MSAPKIRALAGVLIFDAATCVAMGIVLMAFSGPLSRLTAIPGPVMIWSGAVLIPIALYMLLVARSGTGHPLAVWLVIVGNLGWVAASLALLGMISPNGLGVALILVQALVVALLAWLERRALRSPAARHEVAA